MKFIIGTKLNMTQIWQSDDKVAGVTPIQAGPCTVVQVKTSGKDGYSAVQLGFGQRKAKNINKPQKGHMKGLDNFRCLREFRIEKEELKRGDKIDVSTFVAGDIVNVTGISKGKGFQGVVKRHGFKGQKTTHGTKDQVRMPGSIGATGPAHVFKGTRMPGRMGGKQITTTNLEIVKVDTEKNIIYVNGSVPGARNGLVLLNGAGDLKIAEVLKPESKKAPESENKDTKNKNEVKTPESENKERTESKDKDDKKETK